MLSARLGEERPGVEESGHGDQTRDHSGDNSDPDFN